MSELIAGLIGLFAPWQVGFVLQKINPAQQQSLLSKTLQKLLKDPQQLDATENKIGVQLIKLGAQIVKHSDISEYQKDIRLAEQVEEIQKQF